MFSVVFLNHPKNLLPKLTLAKILIFNNFSIEGELKMRVGNKNAICFFFFFFSTVYLELEKAMAPHSSTLAWKIPWMEEPGGLQSMGSLKVGHD